MLKLFFFLIGCVFFSLKWNCEEINWVMSIIFCGLVIEERFYNDGGNDLNYLFPDVWIFNQNVVLIVRHRHSLRCWRGDGGHVFARAPLVTRNFSFVSVNEKEIRKIHTNKGWVTRVRTVKQIVKSHKSEDLLTSCLIPSCRRWRHMQTRVRKGRDCWCRDTKRLEWLKV